MLQARRTGATASPALLSPTVGSGNGGAGGAGGQASSASSNNGSGGVGGQGGNGGSSVTAVPAVPVTADRTRTVRSAPASAVTAATAATAAPPPVPPEAKRGRWRRADRREPCHGAGRPGGGRTVGRHPVNTTHLSQSTDGRTQHGVGAQRGVPVMIRTEGNRRTRRKHAIGCGKRGWHWPGNRRGHDRRFDDGA